MSKIGWDHTLYKFGRIRFGKTNDPTDDDSINDISYSATMDESANDEIVDELNYLYQIIRKKD